MATEKPITVLELQTETDTFLEWVEKRKMNGFLGKEIEYFRNILEGCLETETFGEVVEQLKDQVRKWIRDQWNLTVIGKTYQRHRNRTPRAKVIQVFPALLIDFLDLLSKIEQYELNREEQEIFQQILLRFEVSLMTLELKSPEKKEPPERKKKSGRSKPPRCHK